MKQELNKCLSTPSLFTQIDFLLEAVTAKTQGKGESVFSPLMVEHLSCQEEVSSLRVIPVKISRDNGMNQNEAHVLCRNNECQLPTTVNYGASKDGFIAYFLYKPVSISVQCSQPPYEEDAIGNKKKKSLSLVASTANCDIS